MKYFQKLFFLASSILLLSGCAVQGMKNRECAISLPDNGFIRDPDIENQYVLKLQAMDSCAHLKKNLDRRAREEREFLMATKDYESYKTISIKREGQEYIYTFRFTKETWAEK